jgi:hypothetical protein
MATTTTLELESYTEEPRPSEQQVGNNGIHTEGSINPQQLQILQGLEPVDGGFSAWKLLFGAFSFEAILWGKAQYNS